MSRDNSEPPADAVIDQSDRAEDMIFGIMPSSALADTGSDEAATPPVAPGGDNATAVSTGRLASRTATCGLGLDDLSAPTGGLRASSQTTSATGIITEPAEACVNRGKAERRSLDTFATSAALRMRAANLPPLVNSAAGRSIAGGFGSVAKIADAMSVATTEPPTCKASLASVLGNGVLVRSIESLPGSYDRMNILRLFGANQWPVVGFRGPEARYLRRVPRMQRAPCRLASRGALILCHVRRPPIEEPGASSSSSSKPRPVMTTPHETLSDLRIEIDRIDAAMHELLIERGTIIDRLIAVKARSGGGSAFRPEREAAMMRHIAERHRGPLPLDTVEGIWRIIISTFTYVQAAYAVHADMAGGDAAMRDSVRFHFGFTVPLVTHAGAAAVIAAVASAAGDLGLLRLDAGASAGSWWRRLIPAEAPKIIARLPFVERPDHPAGMPIFVVARPSSASAVREIVVYAISVDRWRPELAQVIAAEGGEVVGEAADEIGLGLLIAVPGDVEIDTLRRNLAKAGGDVRLAEVGSHAARYGFKAARPASAAA